MQWLDSPPGRDSCSILPASEMKATSMQYQWMLQQGRQVLCSAFMAARLVNNNACAGPKCTCQLWAWCKACCVMSQYQTTSTGACMQQQLTSTCRTAVPHLVEQFACSSSSAHHICMPECQVSAPHLVETWLALSDNSSTLLQLPSGWRQALSVATRSIIPGDVAKRAADNTST